MITALRRPKKEREDGCDLKTTVCPDGDTATFEFTDSTDTSSNPIIGKGTMGRVAKSKRPPAGSHAISGSWQISKTESVSDNALMFTFKLEGDSLTMSNPTGQSYIAKMDGTDTPYKGDPGIDSISSAPGQEHDCGNLQTQREAR
jgi:hypothetical protein